MFGSKHEVVEIRADILQNEGWNMQSSINKTFTSVLSEFSWLEPYDVACCLTNFK